MLRSLLGLESAEARETRRSLADYEACRDQRRKRLMQYRADAIAQILAKDPKMALCMDAAAPSFVGASALQRVLVEGTFVDRLYPDLDYIPESASNAARTRAILDFKTRAAHYDAGRYKEAGCFDREQTDYFDKDDLARGYRISEDPFDHLVSLTVSRNDEVLAHMTSFVHLDLEIILRRLFDAVLFDCAGNPRAVSCLEISVGVAPDAITFGRAKFQQFYSDRFRQAPHMDSKERKNICESVGLLIHTIYPAVCAIPLSLGVNLDDEWEMETYRNGFFGPG
jgi:hypothetical protein